MSKLVAQRLYVQAAFSAAFPLLNLTRDGKSWLLIGLALAAACLGLAFYVRQGNESARAAVIAFEAVALVVGVVALLGHHYVPGSIVGAWTLFAVMSGGARSSATAVAAPAPQAASVTAPPGARDILPGK